MASVMNNRNIVINIQTMDIHRELAMYAVQFTVLVSVSNNNK